MMELVCGAVRSFFLPPSPPVRAWQSSSSRSFRAPAHGPEMTSEYDRFGELAAWATVSGSAHGIRPLLDAEGGAP